MLVPVYDSQDNLVESVEPAVVRFALKRGYVTTRSRDPYTVVLAQDLRRIPYPSAQREKHMEANPSQTIKQLRRMLEGTEDIWARALPDPTQKALIQVVLNVRIGEEAVRVPPISGLAPVNLMNYAPIEVWRTNGDLRTQVQRGRLLLMTEKEADAWFQARAAAKGRSAAAEKDAAYKSELEFMSHRTPTDELSRSDAEAEEAKFVSAKNGLKLESEVKPRVMQLCAEAAKDLPVKERIKEGDLMQELQAMEAILTAVDLDHIASFANYKRVKDWARSVAANLEESAPVAHNVGDIDF